MRLPQLLLLAALAPACAPPEAPTTIEEMMVFGFEHFDDEPEYMLALAENLNPWLEDNFVEASEGYVVDSLGQENLATVGIDTQLDEGILGAMVGLEYQVSIDDLVWVFTAENQADIMSSYLDFEQDETQNRDCFRDRSCETYSSDEHIHVDMGVLGIELWNSLNAQARWLDLDDGSKVLITRNLGPDPIEFNVDFLDVDQQYAFTYTVERSNGTSRRVHAIWVSGQVVGADLPVAFQVNSGITALKQAAEDTETWLLTEGADGQE